MAAVALARMDRAVVVALVALGVVLVGVIGAGVGYAYFFNTPVAQVERDYAAGRLGPAGIYSNLRIVASTSDSVVYEFDLADGQHCTGRRTVGRRGLIVSGSSGMVSCSGGPWGQQFPPTQVNCSALTATATGPNPTSTGFAVIVTNTSAAPCHLMGPVRVEFLPAPGLGPPANVDLRAAREPSVDLVLQPGRTAELDYDVAGGGPCYSSGSVEVLVAGPPLAVPGLRVCGRVTAHVPRLAP